MNLRPDKFPEGDILSPANLLSVAGFCLVAYGIYEGVDTKKGMTLIATGRACDLLDGWVADVTNSKSELGALVDTGLDKLALFGIATASYHKGSISEQDYAAIIAEDSFNAGATLYAKRRNPNRELSRSWVGGGSMFFKNAGIIINDIGGVIEQEAALKYEAALLTPLPEREQIVADIRRDLAVADTMQRVGDMALRIGIRELGVLTSAGYGLRALR